MDLTMSLNEKRRNIIKYKNQTSWKGKNGGKGRRTNCRRFGEAERRGGASGR